MMVQLCNYSIANALELLHSYAKPSMSPFVTYDNHNHNCVFLFSSPGDQVRVLFVADPQLPGIEKEPNPWGLFSRWDADR